MECIRPSKLVDCLTNYLRHEATNAKQREAFISPTIMYGRLRISASWFMCSLFMVVGGSLRRESVGLAQGFVKISLNARQTIKKFCEKEQNLNVRTAASLHG